MKELIKEKADQILPSLPTEYNVLFNCWYEDTYYLRTPAGKKLFISVLKDVWEKGTGKQDTWSVSAIHCNWAKTWKELFIIDAVSNIIDSQKSLDIRFERALL